MRERRPLLWAIGVGFATVLLILIAGASLLLERSWQTARSSADATLRQSALIVESMVNRQFLQVDGALASLPGLFETVAQDGSPIDPRAAERLLRGLNFLTFAFRDIMLLRPDGGVWASSQTNSWKQPAPIDLTASIAGVRGGSALVVGPVRDPLTGDWLLLIVRQVSVPGVGPLNAVAELPLPLIGNLFASVSGIPGLSVSLRRRNGQLLVNQPYDEPRIGLSAGDAIPSREANGAVFTVPPDQPQAPMIGIARPSLYGDVLVALTLDLRTAMAGWQRDRDRMILAAFAGGGLLFVLALILFVAVRQRGRAEDRIRFVAHHDALTKLPNRVLFHDRLADRLAHLRADEHLALLCLDLDKFKEVNDALGHPIGDALLQAVAIRLSDRARDSGIVARLGGDEFSLVLAPIGQPAEAADFATRIIALLGEPFDVRGHRIVIGTSIGIAFSPQDGTDADQLMKNADLAMYRAKHDGRGVYRLFQPEMDARMQTRRTLELDLRGALGLGQFVLNYQPLIGVQARKVVGFEALLRWRHPVRGLVPPDQFIPMAEETGVIVPIGEWVLRTACMVASTWPDDLKIAVNLSPVQLKNPDIVATVRQALDCSGLAPDRLELEITEAVLLRDTAATLATLRAFHAMGVRISMDDFGTGYSSLSYLHRFPFDRIKIDQSFVRGLGQERDCDAIVRAVLALARELNMSTTAEGVETPEQLHALMDAGCAVVQGFLFSRAVPETDVLALLHTMPALEDMKRSGAGLEPERDDPSELELTASRFRGA
jgi:diguanylate cyclase (GGDEF)-like protein